MCMPAEILQRPGAISNQGSPVKVGVAVVSGEYLVYEKSLGRILGRPVWENKANLNLHIWIRNVDKASKRERAQNADMQW